MNDPNQSARLNELLNRLGSDLTEEDFADLAVACADQAGLRVPAQRRLREDLQDALALSESREDLARAESRRLSEESWATWPEVTSNEIRESFSKITVTKKP